MKFDKLTEAEQIKLDQLYDYVEKNIDFYVKKAQMKKDEEVAFFKAAKFDEIVGIVHHA